MGRQLSVACGQRSFERLDIRVLEQSSVQIQTASRRISLYPPTPLPNNRIPEKAHFDPDRRLREKSGFDSSSSVANPAIIPADISRDVRPESCHTSARWSVNGYVAWLG